VSTGYEFLVGFDVICSNRSDCEGGSIVCRLCGDMVIAECEDHFTLADAVEAARTHALVCP
jgi:hypothetical protein